MSLAVFAAALVGFVALTSATAFFLWWVWDVAFSRRAALLPRRDMEGAERRFAWAAAAFFISALFMDLANFLTPIETPSAPLVLAITGVMALEAARRHRLFQLETPTEKPQGDAS